jgi:hypothetical protein
VNQDLITSTLVEHAEAVDHLGPDLDSLHARVAKTRRRRHAAAGVAGGIAVVVAVAAGAVVGGDVGPEPTPSPSPPTSSESERPFRADAVEVTPPADARESAQRMRVVTHERNEPGQAELRFELSLTDTYTADELYCGGAPGTWLVAATATGARATVPCDGPVSLPRPWPTQPFLHGTANMLTEDDTVTPVHLFVTTADASRGRLRTWLEGIPATTTADFGLVMYGQTSPTVGTIVGFDVSVLGEFDGRDWWFVRGVEAPTGAQRLTIELPASTQDRMVQPVVAAPTSCCPPSPNPSLQIYLDGRAVDHRFDKPRVAFLEETTAFVPAGAPHTIQVRTTKGWTDDADFGIAVFEAD